MSEISIEKVRRKDMIECPNCHYKSNIGGNIELLMDTKDQKVREKLEELKKEICTDSGEKSAINRCQTQGKNDDRWVCKNCQSIDTVFAEFMEKK